MTLPMCLLPIILVTVVVHQHIKTLNVCDSDLIIIETLSEVHHNQTIILNILTYYICPLWLTLFFALALLAEISLGYVVATCIKLGWFQVLMALATFVRQNLSIQSGHF
jgi:hypothetical protein